MPILNLLPSAFSINDAFLLLSAFDRANITASSPTGVVYASNQFFGGTFTVTGTGLTTAFFGGVEYITGGTIDGIFITEGGFDLCQFTDLGLSGAAFFAAMRPDREGFDEAAVEDLFRKLTYTINGRGVADGHIPEPGFEGESIALTRNNTYNLGAGDDTVTAAGAGATRSLARAATTVCLATMATTASTAGRTTIRCMAGLGRISWTAAAATTASMAVWGTIA